MLNSDSLYHRLFSHPQMVQDLVREFVPAAVAAGADLSGLRRINAKFHADRQSAGRGLARRDSLAALLFRLERRQSEEEFRKLIVEVRDWFSRHPEFEPLKRPFSELTKRPFEGLELNTSPPDSFEEQDTMLATLP